MNEAIKNRIEQVRRGEVPEGYKRTRAGLTPDSWIREGEIKASALFKNHSNKAHGGAFEVLSATQEKGIIPRSEVEIDIKYDTDNLSSYKKVDIGDFVISLRSFQGGIEFSPYEGLVSPAYTVIKAKRQICEEFYKPYFKTIDFVSRLNCTIYGIRDGKQIGFEDFGNLAIHYPPLPEQQKIAEILACCDKVVSLKKQLLDEKRRQKKWLVQKLLDPNSEYRVPGFENNIWKTFSLADLGTFSKGTGISNEDCASGEFPCIKYGDIYMTYDVSFNDAVSHTETDIASNSPHIEGGCLLFTGSGEDRLEIGKCTAYMGSTSLAVGGDIVIMKPNERKVSPLFLAYTQFTDALIRQKARVSQGYSIVHLYADDIRKLIVDIPLNLQEQKAIVEILSAADREIDLLDQEILQWQHKKKSLMQLLLTGIVRVNV